MQPNAEGGLALLRQLTDEELARRACHAHPQHDPLAVQVLMERYYDLLVGAVVRRFRDRELARDAAQTVFLRLLQCQGCNPAKRSGSINVRSCLRLDAIHQAINLLRDQRGLVPLEFAEEGAGLREGDPTEPPPAGRIDPEVARRINDCLDRLPEPERTVLMLRDVDGFTAKGVAEALGIRQDRIDRIRDRARKSIRACLEEGCRAFLSEQERRLLKLVEDEKLPAIRAAERLAAELAEPGDGDLPEEERRHRLEERATRVLAQARDKWRRCMEQYERAEIRLEGLQEEDSLQDEVGDR